MSPGVTLSALEQATGFDVRLHPAHVVRAPLTRDERDALAEVRGEKRVAGA